MILNKYHIKEAIYNIIVEYANNIL